MWKLHLRSRGLTGRVAPHLANVRELRELGLHHNRLTGPIPPELGSLRHLEILWLDANQLSGSIPPALGSLRSLREIWLYDNQLTGRIPAELGELVALKSLRLSGNPGLTGCISRTLRGVPHNDLSLLGLAHCGMPPPSLCENGTAVPNPADNPGLVADCVALLTIRDPLRGHAPLNWDPATRDRGVGWCHRRR